jgi:hypothetical protein
MGPRESSVAGTVEDFIPDGSSKLYVFYLLRVVSLYGNDTSIESSHLYGVHNLRLSANHIDIHGRTHLLLGKDQGSQASAGDII